MAINFDNALGIHAEALDYRSRRAEVLANNLANADTPGFKARDLSFEQALRNASSQRGNLTRTHEKHVDSRASTTAYDRLAYRIPLQPDTGDGNTVDSQSEMARFSQNALEFQTSLHFLSGKFRSLTTALRGE